MSDLVKAAFWKQTLERAVKTAAQSAIAAIGSAAAFNAVDWTVAGSTVLLATILSALMSIASARVSGDKESPSLV